MQSAHSTPGALDGIRVVELASEFTVYGGKLLAELGAEVILVEPPGGDALRARGPFWRDRPGPNTSLFFWHYCAGKRSVALDIEAPGDRAALLRLLATADVVLEGFAPGYLASRGLGHADLARERPDLIVTSVTPYGQDGPYAGFQASDLVATATGGLMYLTGFPDRAPSWPGGNQSLHVAGATAAYASLIALYHRLRTGEGQHVDISVQQAMALCQEDAIQWWDLVGRIRRRQGTRLRGPVSGHVPCKDGYVYINMRDGWPDLVAWMEAEGLAGDLTDAKWNNLQTRIAHEDYVNEAVKPFFMSHTKEEITREAQKRRLLIMPVQDMGEAARDPQLVELGFFRQVRHDDLDETITYGGTPYALSRTPTRLTGPAPRLNDYAAEPAPNLAARPAAAPTADPTAGSDALPLSGLRVLDFTWWIAGPAATKQLAAHGAEVIKIESASHIDPVRPLEPFPPAIPGINSGGYFNNLNTDKLSVSLDMTTDEARRLVRDLVATCDVVFDNYAGAWVMQRWGLDYDSLRAINPDIIVVSMPAFAPNGPRSHYRALGNHLGAAIGLSSMTGYPDRPPVSISVVAFPDHGCNPFHALTATMAAVIYRERAGGGQSIMVPQYESTACFLGPALLDYTVNGRVATRAGNGHPSAAPHGVYRCRPEPADEDRWVAIAVFTEPQWRALCAVMERPSLAGDPRFATPVERLRHRDTLDAAIEAWTAGQDARAVMERLQVAGVPAGMVESARDLMEDDPQMRARGHYVTMEHPVVGRIRHDGPPARLRRTPGRLRRPAPVLGEHTHAVLRGHLGLSDDDITNLVIAGAME